MRVCEKCIILYHYLLIKYTYYLIIFNNIIKQTFYLFIFYFFYKCCIHGTSEKVSLYLDLRHFKRSLKKENMAATRIALLIFYKKNLVNRHVIHLTERGKIIERTQKSYQ